MRDARNTLVSLRAYFSTEYRFEFDSGVEESRVYRAAHAQGWERIPNRWFE